MASGGDIGCNSVIFWDTRTWTIKNRLQAHTAAISGIIDMLDDQSLAISSYDKKITIYNYRVHEIIYSTADSKTAISCIALSSNGKRLVSGGLDNNLSVWTIMKRSGRVESIHLDRTITNCGLICSLR